MVELLKCQEHAAGEEFLVKIDQLHSLEDAGILADPNMRRAIRGLDKGYIERLMFSDPNLWLAIVITVRNPIALRSGLVYLLDAFVQAGTSLNLTRLSPGMDSVRSEYIGTSGCVASPLLYGS